MQHRIRGRLRVVVEEALGVGVELHDRQPLLHALAVLREGLVDVEDAREVLGALHVARHPEAVLGEAGEQAIQAPRYPSCPRPARS